MSDVGARAAELPDRLEDSLSRTVMRGARWPGDLAISGGRIVGIGDVRAEAGDSVIDCSGDILTPGLVNTHHHLWQWLTRGRAVGCDLFDWLSELYPIWARMSPDDVLAAAVVGMSELALTGCTTTVDHHYVVPRGTVEVFDALIEASGVVGLRFLLGRGCMDLGHSRGGLPPDEIVEKPDDVFASLEALVARAERAGVEVFLAPNSLFTTSLELIRACHSFAAARDLRMHIHLAESPDEERFSHERYGRGPIELLDEEHLLTDRLWIAHATHLADGDVQRLAQAGAGVAHCPSSNGRLSAGICPVNDLLDAGVPVGLGVDGAASNEIGGLFPELRQALFTARQRTGDPSLFMPMDALTLATEGGATCLGLTEAGALVAGSRADVVSWPAGDLRDIDDAIAGLVLGPDRRARHVLVDGRPVVLDGELTNLDLGVWRERFVERVHALEN